MATFTSSDRRRGDLRAIFVHAGAGYHSVQNESLHLRACEDACKAAMAILKGGGSAVDAVEMAIKILEDREITNAGYGSNLTMDGVVECDALVVDHHGRSGAVGAVGQIKNPISLARLLLDRSTKALPLRRVPPNLLCGEGASKWAYEHGMEILPRNGLISPAAFERWKKWKEDLEKVDHKHAKRARTSSLAHTRPPLERVDILLKQRPLVKRNKTPMTPPGSSSETSLSPNAGSETPASSPSTPDNYRTSSPSTPLTYPSAAAHVSRNPLINSTQQLPLLSDSSDGVVTTPRMRAATNTPMSETSGTDHQIPTDWTRLPARLNRWQDGSSGEDDDSSASTLQLTSLTSSPPVETASNEDTGLKSVLRASSATSRDSSNGRQIEAPHDNPEDMITDTVGAIAIDQYGNIAAGASSGGIGMKYRGRVGPAALVGVGASVIPIQADDPDRLCVATVTSGTGEHMATTLSAQTCADRMYHGLKKGGNMMYVPMGAHNGGGDLDQTASKGLSLAEHDDDVMRSFVENDFMSHQSVKYSTSIGAVGVLTVKKTTDGVYMYFAHNTDSFALASMHANEDKPACCMSRSSGNGAIAQGGRAMRVRRRM